MNEDLMFITLDYYVKVIGKDAEEGTLEKNVSDAIEMLVEKYNKLLNMKYLDPYKWDLKEKRSKS